jgi:hypothetical protein
MPMLINFQAAQYKENKIEVTSQLTSNPLFSKPVYRSNISKGIEIES